MSDDETQTNSDDETQQTRSDDAAQARRAVLIRETVLAVLFAVAAALIAGGVAAIYAPAGLIVGGVLVAALAVVTVGEWP